MWKRFKKFILNLARLFSFKKNVYFVQPNTFNEKKTESKEISSSKKSEEKCKGLPRHCEQNVI